MRASSLRVQLDPTALAGEVVILVIADDDKGLDKIFQPMTTSLDVDLSAVLAQE